VTSYAEKHKHTWRNWRFFF